MIQKTVLFLTFAATLGAAPQLGLSSASVGPIHAFPGSNGAAQTVQAYNLGTGSLNLTTTVSATWLAASVGTAQTCKLGNGTCNPISISLNTAALAAGLYTGYVTLVDPNAVDSPQQITVTVNVAGIPSSLNFYVTPDNGSGGQTFVAFSNIYTQGTGVTGTATTQSGGNWLSFLNGSLFNTGTPYSIQGAAIVGLAPGSYNGSVVLTAGTSPADNKTVNVTLDVTTSPIIQLTNPVVQLSGYAGGANPSTSVSFTNIGEGTLTITGATASSSTGNFLSASVSNANTIVITANPGTLTPGIYSGAVTLTSNAANNSQVSVPVSFTVEAVGTPLIYSDGIVDNATYSVGPVAPGEALDVYGDQLAPPGTSALNPGLPPLATTLGNVQVLVNGVPAPLYFASPGQVNFQLPYEVPAGQTATVQVVSKGVPGNVRPLTVIASVPRLLVWTPNIITGGYGIVENSDYSLVLPSSTVISGYTSRPAKPGDSITIYCIGLGQTTPSAITGAAATSSPLESISNVTVTFSGGFQGPAVTANAFFAGLSPAWVGLYQVNVTIPANVTTGSAVPVTVNMNGASSNVVYIPISQ